VELTLDEALKKGIEAHKSGQVQEADRLYAAVLKAEPNHPDANHNMGVLAVGVGNVQKALPFFKTALEIKPGVAQFWLSYIDALIKIGRIADGKAVFDQAKVKGAKGEAFDQLEKRLFEPSSNPQDPPSAQLQSIINLYTQGQLQQALSDATEMLEKFPNSAVLYNIAGASNAGLMQFDAAVDSFKQLLKINPHYAEAYNNMGVALQDKGDPEAAIDSYKQALKINPDYAEAYYNMGVALKDKGDLEAAIDSYKKALKCNSDYAEAYNNMGVALQDKGDLEAATASYKQALKINPDHAEAYNGIGNVLNAKGDPAAAIVSYKQALKINPDYAEAYYNMGVALNDKGDSEAAIDSYKQALKIKPDYAEAYYNMGVALNGKGDLEAAISSYKEAIKIEPNYAEAYYNIGVSIQEKGELETAIDNYKHALKINPDYFEAYNNMGNALDANGELEAAIDSFKQVLKIKPDDASAYCNMGNVLHHKGDLESAIESYAMALKIKPDYQAAHTGKLHQQSYMCDWAALEQGRDLIAKLGTSTESISPFGMLPLEDAPKRHRMRSETFTKKLYRYRTPLPPAAKPSQKPQRLRIGYFSADFHEHPVTYLMAKVLEVHDRTCFEVYGYSIGPVRDDDMRQRLIKAVDVFIDVHDMNDQDIALLARQDKIDIAVDLTGYTKNYRAGIFAYRAAPVQINYLGYPGTMGADFIDYIIADQTLIPIDSQKFYSEKPIYLPHHYQAQDNTLPISDDTPSRLDLGLPEDGFVFCCFNNNYKISPSEFDIWMRLLGHVDGSVLWLLESNKWVKVNLLKEAQLRGISADRLVFAQKVSHEKYLAQFRRADLYLDTFNYNAGATASNALWAGLPVLTKLGEGYTARMAGSLLPSIGLPELATHSEEDYESLAMALATDSERLAKIRQTLADNRLSTPLFDTELFTKHLEDGYQQVYQRYYDGKLPEAIIVPEHR
jgi:protein O-GlcNAc transferase